MRVINLVGGGQIQINNEVDIFAAIADAQAYFSPLMQGAFVAETPYNIVVTA